MHWSPSRGSWDILIELTLHRHWQELRWYWNILYDDCLCRKNDIYVTAIKHKTLYIFYKSIYKSSFLKEFVWQDVCLSAGYFSWWHKWVTFSSKAVVKCCEWTSEARLKKNMVRQMEALITRDAVYAPGLQPQHPSTCWNSDPRALSCHYCIITWFYMIPLQVLVSDENQTLQPLFSFHKQQAFNNAAVTFIFTQMLNFLLCKLRKTTQVKTEQVEKQLHTPCCFIIS